MPAEIIDTAYKVTEPGVIKAADDGTPIPIGATSLGRLEDAEADKFEQTRGGGAYAEKWTGGWAKWQGWFGSSGTTWDAWLTTTSSQIGQIMLSMPNAYAKMGLKAGLVLSLFSGLVSCYTIMLLVHLYEERKRRLILEDKWYGDKGASKRITQYHEVVTYLCGRFLGALLAFFLIINVFGISVAQVVACSSDAYYWRTSLDKRTWALIFGAILQLSVLVPTLRHTRVINILGLIGTTYTVWWIVIAAGHSGRGVQHPDATAGPHNRQLFFTGLGVLLVAYGGHSISFEVMDGMNVPKRYRLIGFLSFMYIFTLTVPHSTAVQLVYPKNNAKYGNVYGALPHTWAMNISIFLMIVHQICAFIYYNAPLFYMWEKLLGIHEKNIWLRIVSRLPITLLAWLVGIAFPFYGTLNSVIGAFSGPVVAFAMPCLAFNLVYRTKKARSEAALSPVRWMVAKAGWTPIFVFNWFIILVYIISGTGFALVYSIKTFADAVHQYKFFAKCYQC